MRQARILHHENIPGILKEADKGKYIYQNNSAYIDKFPVHLLTFSMPFINEPYLENRFLTFFKGLILKVGFFRASFI